MFRSLKLSQFGQHIKQIRQSAGLSQAIVADQAGLSRDTIRRIEKGEVVVRFDTLVLLSEIYKRDLLEDLRFFSDSTVLFTYYHRLDELIVSNDIETLSQLRQDFDQFTQQFETDYPIIINIKKQFDRFLDAISALISQQYETSIDILVEAIRYTNPLFDLDDLTSFQYTLFEQRLLIVLAQAVSRIGAYQQSNKILHVLYKRLSKVSGVSLNEKQLLIKILINLADNYHRLENDKQVVKVAQNGINYCNEHFLIYGLHFFLYRLGIAKFHLKKPDYLLPIKQAITTLRIQQMNEMADYYVDITKQQYNITEIE